jgi:hypothetical protein
LAALLSGPPSAVAAPKRAKARLLELFARGRTGAAAEEASSIPEQHLISRWETQAHEAGDECQAAVYGALARVVSALVIRHGGVWGSRPLLASLATDIACNKYGSDEIGRLIDPWIRKAAADGPYRLLPRQEEPVVMNTKGPSASGKSSLRPLQKRLAGDIGVNWTDFALISPDIWRKQLLEYGTLGPDYKYGGKYRLLSPQERAANSCPNTARSGPTTNMAALSPVTKYILSTTSSTVTWRAKPSARTSRIY